MPATDAGRERPADVLDSAEAGGLVVRGGIVRVAGFVGGLLFSLGGVALVTRHLGPALYARYQTVASLIMVVAALTDLGMSTLGVREYVQRRGDDRLQLMRLLLGLRLVLTAAGVLVAMAIIASAEDWGWELVVGTGLMGIGVVFTVLQTTLAIPLNADLRLGTITAIDVTRQAATALLFAGLVAAGAGILPFLAVTVPVHAALLVWTALLVRDRIPLRPRFDRRASWVLIRSSVAFAMATAVGITYQYIAQILTTFVADDTAAGLFSASFRVFIVVAAIPGLLVTSAFPLLSRAAEGDGRRLANVVRGLFDGTLLLGIAAAITCVLGAPAIIEVVAGPQYADAAGALRIQGAALLMTFVIATWGFTLLAQHRHRPLLLANLASLCVTAVVVAVLAAAYDEQGAAVGTLVGESVLAVGYGFAVSRHRPELRPPLGVIARAIPAGAIAVAAGALLGLGAVPDTILGLLVFGVLVLVLRLVPPDLLALLPERLRRQLSR
ncbi:MAG: oligosaccharide flippase family protein [Solirubrobacterales bacterium]|nr:oligosaccharide flippase family protein [Solirubrobacterales bacterium]